MRINSIIIFIYQWPPHYHVVLSGYLHSTQYSTNGYGTVRSTWDPAAPVVELQYRAFLLYPTTVPAKP
jgi:hypothetical protein